jgi:hypothetical protein
MGIGRPDTAWPRRTVLNEYSSARSYAILMPPHCACASRVSFSCILVEVVSMYCGQTVQRSMLNMQLTCSYLLALLPTS